MLLTTEEQGYVRQAVLEAFPDHPNIEAEFHENPHVIEQLPFALNLRTAITRSTPIKSKCNTRYQAVHSSGRRDQGMISCMVVHCTQAYPGLGSARWFANVASAGSAQLILDNKVCYRTLSDLVIPWAAPGMNTFGLHYEFAGFTTWSNDTWKNHDTELRRGAFKMAVASKRYGIRIEWLSANDMKNGKRNGITDHYAVTQAFHLSTHSDPRPNFPRKLLLDYIHHYRRQL